MGGMDSGSGKKGVLSFFSCQALAVDGRWVGWPSKVAPSHAIPVQCEVRLENTCQTGEGAQKGRVICLEALDARASRAKRAPRGVNRWNLRSNRMSSRGAPSVVQEAMME